jgi:hypothetical protein
LGVSGSVAVGCGARPPCAAAASRDAADRTAGDRRDGDDAYLSKGRGRASAGGSTRPSSAATSSGGVPPSKANRWAADLLRSQQCS